MGRLALDQVDPTQPVGSIVAVQVDGEPMVAIRTVAGWLLTLDRCPHAQCAFSADGELAGDGTLICNCHGSEFALPSGEVALGPAQQGLAMTELRVERNRLNSVAG